MALLHWILRKQLEVQKKQISCVTRRAFALSSRWLWQTDAVALQRQRRNKANDKSKNKTARLIVATSETDADMLYATNFWAPDPFIFLERNGKRTLVLSDLEIDRGRKQAKADEFVMFSELEREVQGKSKKAPPYEKVLAHFLRKRGVRSAVVPANFPLGYAEELAANKIRVRATNGLFWPEREAKSEKEIEMIGRALRITETGLRRAIEILKASKPGARKAIALERQNADFRNAPRGN